MKEHKFDVNSFIGGWYIPKKLCDNLIKFFKTHKDRSIEGFIDGVQGSVVDKSWKESRELKIHRNYMEGVIKDYRQQLQKVTDLYLKKYPMSNKVAPFAIVENYNLQYYEKNQGFKKWHNERSSYDISPRHLVFMTYLNDVDDGGTYFYHQKITSPAKKGLTLIWPTDWTHTHKGQISKKHEKYIITGWFSHVSKDLL